MLLVGFYFRVKIGQILLTLICFSYSTVAAIKMNEPLRELYLADNKLMPTDGIQLGNLLKFNHRLTLLDVRNNHLGVSEI